MKPEATQEEKGAVSEKIKSLGYTPHEIVGVERQVFGAVGDERGKAQLQVIESMSGVEGVFPILKPYKLASREVKKNQFHYHCRRSAYRRQAPCHHGRTLFR